MVDSVHDSSNVMARIVELGAAGVNELARSGRNSLLAALLARLGLPNTTDGELASEDQASPAEMITRRLLAG